MPFKDHFSGHSADYRDSRPGYPDALFDWLAAQAPDRALVWDAGCGNGQASVALATRFARVFASDPSAPQIANALPRANVDSNIDYRVEPAETCSLPDHSADLVTIAQALHWFDLPRFYAEARRVLKPHGVLAAWTYSDCRVSPAVDALKQRVYVDLTGPYWPAERVHVDAGYLDLPFPFSEIAAPAFAMVRHWSADHFLGYLRSWSASQRYLAARGEDPVAEVEAPLRRAWGDGIRDVHWDFHLRCGR